MNRKDFISKSALVTASAPFIPSLFLPKSNEDFEKEQIKELVFAAHNNFEKTKSIIEKHPLLLDSANQAQKGDFETSMGAAAHMGRKDIAEFLLKRGARLNIFSLTFLGHAELVKQLISIYPQYLNAPGPHGFTLLHHAQVGKHKEFEKWLIDKGLKETRFENVFG